MANTNTNTATALHNKNATKTFIDIKYAQTQISALFGSERISLKSPITNHLERLLSKYEEFSLKLSKLNNGKSIWPFGPRKRNISKKLRSNLQKIKSEITGIMKAFSSLRSQSV
jgi:hypothetical protein